MKDLGEIMRQAQQMQAKLAEAQSKVETVEAEGTSGGGLLRVVLRGRGELVSVSIDESLFRAEDREIVEDLIKAAHEEARRNLEAKTAEAMKDATAGLGGMLPGFKLPF